MSDVNERNAPADWVQFVENHGVGDELRGQVTSLVRFGAFVEVAPGVEGLLHESEYDTAPTLGAELIVRVDGLDSSTRRMSLALA